MSPLVEFRPLSPSQDSDSQFIETEHGDKYVLRRIKPAHKLHDIELEYDGLGFTNTYNGSLATRTLDEQEAFLEKCAIYELPVAQPVARLTDGLVFPFIEGQVYSDLLSTETSAERLDAVVGVYLEDLIHAHYSNITYGDRWGPNTIVAADNSIMHIDLDLKLGGPFAMEFELAQGIYHTIFFAGTQGRREFVVETISDVLISTQQDPGYDSDTVIQFLRNHMNYFNNQIYACPETSLLLNTLRAN